MSLFCEQCGHENEEGARFCVECGAKLRSKPKGPDRSEKANFFDSFGKNKKERQIMIASLAAVLVVGGMIAALSFNVSSSVQASEYSKSIALGDQYLANGDYENAQFAFNEAIKINPKQSAAYNKARDVYIKVGDNERAKEVVKQRDENVSKDEDKNNEEVQPTQPNNAPIDEVGGQEPTQKPTEADKPKQSYAEFVKEKESEGKATIGQEYSASSGKVGLISAAVVDIDQDDEEELITVSCTNNKSMTLAIDLYGMDGDEIIELDSETIDFKDENNPGGEYDLFLKTNDDDEVFLYIQRDRTLGTDANEKGGVLYKIDEEIEKTLDTAAVETTAGYKFTVNNDTHDATNPPSDNAGDPNMETAKEDFDWWAGETSSQLSDAGLDCEGEPSGGDAIHSGIENNLPTFDDTDDSQQHLCQIKRGIDEDYDSGDKLLIKDFTELDV